MPARAARLARDDGQTVGAQEQGERQRLALASENAGQDRADLRLRLFARDVPQPIQVENAEQLLVKADKYGFDIYRDGLSIYTTLDRSRQGGLALLHSLRAVQQLEQVSCAKWRVR